MARSRRGAGGILGCWRLSSTLKITGACSGRSTCLDNERHRTGDVPARRGASATTAYRAAKAEFNSAFVGAEIGKAATAGIRASAFARTSSGTTKTRRSSWIHPSSDENRLNGGGLDWPEVGWIVGNIG